MTTRSRNQFVVSILAIITVVLIGVMIWLAYTIQQNASPPGTGAAGPGEIWRCCDRIENGQCINPTNNGPLTESGPACPAGKVADHCTNCAAPPPSTSSGSGQNCGNGVLDGYEYPTSPSALSPTICDCVGDGNDTGIFNCRWSATHLCINCTLTFSPTQCADGVDNNDTEDTLADCNDPGCLNAQGVCNPLDTSEANTITPACSNGVDDDDAEDSLIDCADPGCLNAQGVCDPTDTSEADVPACANGRDDDGDALIDCADPGCLDSNGVCDPTDDNEFTAPDTAIFSDQTDIVLLGITLILFGFAMLKFNLVDSTLLAINAIPSKMKSYQQSREDSRQAKLLAHAHQKLEKDRNKFESKFDPE